MKIHRAITEVRRRTYCAYCRWCSSFSKKIIDPIDLHNSVNITNLGNVVGPLKLVLARFVPSPYLGIVRVDVRFKYQTR